MESRCHPWDLTQGYVPFFELFTDQRMHRVLFSTRWYSIP